jgi:hypothetical protein
VEVWWSRLVSIHSEETHPSLAPNRGTSGARSALLAAIEKLLCLTTRPVPASDARRDLLTARIRLDEERFDLVEFRRGKSTLINALLGRELLPTGVMRLTSVITAIGASGRDRPVVDYSNGREHEYTVDELPEHVTEAGNPDNRLGVELARLELDHELLRAGIELVGTPGIGSVHSRNTQVTRAFLPRVDAALAADAIRGAVDRAAESRQFGKQLADARSRELTQIDFQCEHMARTIDRWARSRHPRDETELR